MVTQAAFPYRRLLSGKFSKILLFLYQDLSFFERDLIMQAIMTGSHSNTY